MLSCIKCPTKSGKLSVRKVLKMLRRSAATKPAIIEEDFDHQNTTFLQNATPTLLSSLKFQARNDLSYVLSCQSMYNSSDCEDHTFTRELYTIEEVDEENENEEYQLKPFSSMCNLADFDDLTPETLSDITTVSEIDYEWEEYQEDNEEHQQKPLRMRISSMSSLMDIDNLSSDFLSDRHLGTILEDDEEDFVVITDTYVITAYV